VPERFALRGDGGRVATGPLALLAAQAAALARGGAVVHVAAAGGGACRVSATPVGAVRAEWAPPLVLFPDPADLGPPGWLARLQMLLDQGDDPR